MKKITLSLLLAATLCYSHLTFAYMYPRTNWTGFYLGANAGYWDAQNNNVKTTGSVSFINPTYEFGASNNANALAGLATNNTTLHANGFIGGGQAGYNYEYNNGILLGLDLSFDGLTNSNNTSTLQKTVTLVDFDENYAGSLAIKQRINYLGTVTTRLGYLFYPALLGYVTGGFAYSNLTLTTTWSAQESLGSTVYPAINAQRNLNKTFIGWTAGAGIEWLFKPDWSALLEYNYYSQNNENLSTTLAQTNQSVSPPALWASATANTALSLSAWSIRVGINYHF